MRLFGLMGICLALMFAVPAKAQRTEAPQMPELRVEVGPTEALATNGYVGGQIVLRVELLSRHPFEALDFKLPQFPDAEVIELLRPRARKVTSYAGTGYLFETSIAIIPKISGVLTIGAVTAVGYVEPEPDKELHFDLASEPSNVKIAEKSRLYEHPWWLVSDRVEIEETWSVPPEEIRVGEVVQRTVNIRAWGVTGDQLPELELDRTNGVRISLASREQKTDRSPEGLIATAIYVWDLEAEPQQVAFVAPVGMTYWDPIEHRQRRAGVKGLRLEPLPADRQQIADSLMQEAIAEHAQTRFLGMVAVGILALPVLAILVAWAWTRLPTRHDRQFRAALTGRPSPGQMYEAMNAWFSVSEWAPQDFDKAYASRRDLSDQLFSRQHPHGPDPLTLVSDAYGFSKRTRTKRLLGLLRTL